MKTKVYIAVSLDGFIARKNGDIDWLTKYESNEIFESFKEFMNNIDAVVIGRGTYEKVLSFSAWPYSKKVFVLSSTIKTIPDELKEKVSVISLPPKEVINYLSNQNLSSLYIDGGITIQNFLKEDLIDEMIITKVPVLIGNGIPLFGYLEKDINFQHLDTTVYSNGLVKNYYKRSSAAA